MKTMIYVLMIASVSVAQAATVYKCPGKAEGQYTYQEKPCKGAKADEHTMSLVPADENKIKEAQDKLKKALNPDKSIPIQEPMTPPSEMRVSPEKVPSVTIETPHPAATVAPAPKTPPANSASAAQMSPAPPPVVTNAITKKEDASQPKSAY